MRHVFLLPVGGLLFDSISATGIHKRFLDTTLTGTTAGGNPGQVDGNQWVQALGHPNATGHFSIIGYDISKPFGSDAAMDGWTIDMNVTADVPVDKGFKTGATIKVNPPAALVSQTSNGSSVLRADSSWVVCLTSVGELAQSTIDAGKKDDGSCTQMLSEQCAADIRRGLARGQRMDHGRGCPSFNVPQSCKDSLGEFSSATISMDLTDDRLLRGYEVSIASVAIHQSGNNTDYDRIGSTGVPIMINWLRNSTNSSVTESPPVTLACVRTNTTVSGSRVPGAAPGRMDLMAGWIFFSLLASLSLGLL